MAYSLIPGGEKSALTPALKRLLVGAAAVWLLLAGGIVLLQFLSVTAQGEIDDLEQKRNTLTIQIDQMKANLQTSKNERGLFEAVTTSNTLRSEELKEIFDLIPETAALLTFAMEEEEIVMTGISSEPIGRESAMMTALGSRYILELFRVERQKEGVYRFEFRFGYREESL